MPQPHQRFLALILEGDRRRAERYARQVLERHGVRVLYEEVVQPALRDVGDLWAASQLNVADEHLATATAQSAVAALYPLFPWPSRGPKLILACAEGERHDFGLRMAADLLALDGWDERFLGGDVPVEDLVRKVRAFMPRAVGLSMTLRSSVPAVRSAIRLVRTAHPSVKILVGGRATADQLGAAQMLGADAVARSGSEGVEILRGWK